MKKKIKLNALKVESFVTDVSQEAIKGGNRGGDDKSVFVSRAACVVSQACSFTMTTNIFCPVPIDPFTIDAAVCGL